MTTAKSTVIDRVVGHVGGRKRLDGKSGFRMSLGREEREGDDVPCVRFLCYSLGTIQLQSLPCHAALLSVTHSTFVRTSEI